MRVFNDIKDALMAKKQPYTEFDQIINDSRIEHNKLSGYIWDFDPNKISTYKIINQWNDDKKMDFIVDCFDKMHFFYANNNDLGSETIERQRSRIREIYVEKLLKKKIKMTPENLDRLVTTVFENKNFKGYSLWFFPISSVLTQIKNQYKKHTILPDDMIKILNKIKRYIEQNNWHV